MIPSIKTGTAAWSQSRKTGFLVLALAIIILLPAAYRMVRPFVAAFLLAAILAVSLDPLQNRLARHVSRSIAALITTLVAVGPVLLVVFLAGVAIERQIRSGALSGIFHISQRLTASAAPIDSRTVQQAATQLNQVAGAIFTGGLAILFLYVLLVHGKKWLSQMTTFIPLDAEVTNRIAGNVRDAIQANVNGILAVSAADAVLFGIVFSLGGTGSPALWGALAGLASMTPVVGASIVWMPIAVTVAIRKAWLAGLLVAAGCFAGQEAVNLLLRPRVLGKRLRQPPLLIALAVLGATEAFGALGILLGPVIVSVLAALLRELRNQLRPDSDSVV
jgi:predicted PurR-regulated permease PerM